MAIVNVDQWRTKRADYLSDNRVNAAKFQDIAIGNDGLDLGNNPKPIPGSQTALFNELKRKTMQVTQIDAFTYKYFININTDTTDVDLIGERISEFGLIDNENGLAFMWTKEFTPILTAGFNQNIELVVEEV